MQLILHNLFVHYTTVNIIMVGTLEWYILNLINSIIMTFINKSTNRSISPTPTRVRNHHWHMVTHPKNWRRTYIVGVWADCRYRKRTENAALSTKTFAARSATRSESARTNGTRKTRNSRPPGPTIRKLDSKGSWDWSLRFWSICKKAWNTTTCCSKSNLFLISLRKIDNNYYWQ